MLNDPTIRVQAPADSDHDRIFDKFDINRDGNFNGARELDACPTVPGLVSMQGCKIGIESQIDLHIVDQAKVGACPDHSGSCKLPLSGAETRVLDQNNAKFKTAYGRNPKQSLYPTIFDGTVLWWAAALPGAMARAPSGSPSRVTTWSSLRVRNVITFTVPRMIVYQAGDG